MSEARAPRGKPARWWLPAAQKHSIADAHCGRPWVCGCASCLQARHNGYLRHRMTPRWWLDPRWIVPLS
jgi:hypothetical protein